MISFLLPRVLETGEVLEVRPSLGPGNDPSRPFYLATNVRVAEIKVSIWSGGDVGRQKALVADLFHLAYDHGAATGAMDGRPPTDRVLAEQPDNNG